MFDAAVDQAPLRVDAGEGSLQGLHREDDEDAAKDAEQGHELHLLIRPPLEHDVSRSK